ncbi:hypothetical protein GMB70_11400 [Turicibacter sanguinis]|nr:hypothetical protein [Turicibacter sanguinis]
MDISFYKDLVGYEFEEKDKINNKVYVLLGMVQLFYPAVIFLWAWVDNHKVDFGFNGVYFYTGNVWFYFRIVCILFLFGIILTTLGSIFCFVGYNYLTLPKALDVYVFTRRTKRFYKRFPDAPGSVDNSINDWLYKEYIRISHNNRVMNEKKQRVLNFVVSVFYFTLVIGCIGACMFFYTAYY